MTPVEYVVVQWLRDRCNDTILMAPIAVFSVDLANKQLSVLVIGRVPKSGVSKHFSHLKEVRLFPKI